jgi:hypothetical protein
MVRIDLRVVPTYVPKQKMMTRDNVPVSIDAVVYHCPSICFRSFPGKKGKIIGKAVKSDRA